VAAHSLLVRGDRWSSLRAFGMAIAERRRAARARTAVAGEVAYILHRTWVEGVEFRFGKQSAAAAGAAKLIAAIV
jgi:hypothetical protein